MLVFCVITVKAVLILERDQRIRLNHKNEALFVKCDVNLWPRHASANIRQLLLYPLIAIIRSQ
jgi:hypothetical protein